MKKIFLVLPLLLLLTTSVALASVSRTSFRATDGEVNYIGGDSSFSFTRAKLSAWSKITQGKGGLQITTKTTDGKRVVLNLKLNQANIIEDSDTRLYVNSVARGIYYNSRNSILFGRLKRVNLGTLRYDYNKVTGIVNIAGEGDVNFRITGMLVK